MKAKINQLIKLSSKVAIYVPSTIDVNIQVNSSKQTDQTLSFLSGIFGGATSTDALGCWTCEDGSLCKEKVTVCYSYTNSDALSANIDKVVEYCENLCSSMNQEAISLEVNNELYFIS